MRWQNKKDDLSGHPLFSSGGWTRTNDLRVMSPTSYQLLYPAMFGNAKVGNDFYKSKFFFRVRIVVNRERIEMVEEIKYANLLLDTKEEF